MKNESGIVSSVVFLIFGFFLLLICSSSYADCKNQSVVIGPTTFSINLSLSSSDLGKLHETKDTLDLKLLLRNNSASDLYIQDNVSWIYSVNIFLRDRTTGLYIYNSEVSSLLLPPPMSRKDLLKISCGEGLTEKLLLPLRSYDITPGHKYDVTAEYRSSIPKKMGFGLKVYSSEMPPIFAPPIILEIAG